MCSDILCKADALVYLAVTLEELEDGILAGLAEGGSILFQELIEALLFGRNLLLKGPILCWGGGSRRSCCRELI
jgi:hypothetical protein